MEFLRLRHAEAAPAAAAAEPAPREAVLDVGAPGAPGGRPSDGEVPFSELLAQISRGKAALEPEPEVPKPRPAPPPPIDPSKPFHTAVPSDRLFCPVVGFQRNKGYGLLDSSNRKPHSSNYKPDRLELVFASARMDGCSNRIL